MLPLQRFRLVAWLALAVLLTIVVAWSFSWVRDADTTCRGQVSQVTRVTALGVAGTAERWAIADAACAIPGAIDNDDAQVDRDRSALARDTLLVASYVALLVLLCLLGSRISYRGVTRRTGRTLAVAAAAAGVADLVENVGLWVLVARDDPPSSLVAGGLAALVVTKFVVLTIAAVYGAAAFLGGVALLVRGLLGNSVLPQFEPDSQRAPYPRPARGQRLDLSSPSLPHDRFRRPGDRDPTGPPTAVGVCLSGGGIRAASFALGSLQGMIEADALRSVNYVSTVSGGGYTGMAWQVATRHTHDNDLTDPPPPLAASSPEHQFLQREARYLWPPLGDDHHPLRNAKRSTAIFVLVVSEYLRSLLFNVMLLVGVLYVAVRPFGWLGATWLFGGTRNEHHVLDPLARPQHGWHVAAVLAQAAAVALALSPALRPWWRKIGGARWKAEAVGTSIVAATFVYLVLTVDGGLYDRPSDGTPRLTFGWALIVIGIALAVGWTVRTRTKAGAPGFFLAIAVLGLAKMWIDTGFRNVAHAPTSGTGIHTAKVTLHEVDVIARVAAMLVVFVLVAALMRVIVTAAWPPGRESAGWRRFIGFGGLQRSTWGTVRTVVALAIAAATASGTGVWLWSADIGTSFEVTELERWAIIAALVLAAYALLDQKWWSPHQLYKRRLASTFSPARGREPDAPAVTLPYRIATNLSRWAHPVPGQPQLLVCAAAYDTDRPDRADVPAVPFVFASDYVGGVDLGFARSRDLDAVLGRHNAGDGTLQAAAAISGAAVSAAIGSVRKASLSQLIAISNLRLGVWLPAPTYVNELRTKRDGVRWLRLRRFTYLLKEMGNHYDPDDRFVYVTDGGQFENLGIYELLARRCRLIHAFDASGDKDDSIATLRNTMALAEQRLGVTFRPVGGGTSNDLDQVLASLTDATPVDGWGDGRSFVSCSTVVYEVVYPIGIDPDSDAHIGTIVYGKARLAHDILDPDHACDPHDPLCEQCAVRSYALVDAKFPANSTIDQFMDTDQFDAYVALGRRVARRVLAVAPRADADADAEADAEMAAPPEETYTDDVLEVLAEE